ncbi:MAG: TraB/GumN family protein [Bacteroidaceae bacterium]|nr:TraB/GumN family protein [Bacteroidaceae bacterium]
MKRIFFTLVVAVMASIAANAQLLYKISGNGLNTPSYIVGTYHLAPASYVDSIPGARAALETAEQVCGELSMAEMSSLEGTQKVMAAMMLPDGQSLKDVLSEEEFAKLDAFMADVMGVGLSNPMVGAQLGKMTPMAIATQLQLLQYMKMTPGFNPNALIDSYFQTEAAKNGKPVIGFETMDFQISVLYKGRSIERQKVQLMCMIDNREYELMMMKTLTEAYFAQDIAKLLEVTEEKLGNKCDSTPEEDEALIYGRNADWAEKMPAIMGDKSTLFVVGAAHLPGERGVLELLKKKGYAVEVVK